MKKLLLVFLIIISVTTLTACRKKELDNKFFENTSVDSFADASTLLTSYLDRAVSDLEEYYPRNDLESSIWYEPSYLNTDLSEKDTIYRHEFINYHLTDDRSYMRYSDLYNLPYFYLDINSLDECGEIQEGVECSNTYETIDGYVQKYSIQFYMENDTLYLTHSFTPSPGRLETYTFYFYEDDANNDVMEMTIIISEVLDTNYDRMSHTKLIFGESEETFICYDCSLDTTTAGSLEYLYTDFHDYAYDEHPRVESSNIDLFVHLYIDEYDVEGDIFLGESGELFTRDVDDGTELFSYSKYIRNTEILYYSKNHYKVNLSEVAGWDKLQEFPDSYGEYSLYYDDELLSGDYEINVETAVGEYAYFEYSKGSSTIDGIPENILNLNAINLDVPYGNTYFQQRISFGSTTFQNLIAERGLYESYLRNKALFKGEILSLRR